MATIIVDGDNKTAKIVNWTLKSDSQNRLQLTCHFRSGKTYTRPFSVCNVEPTTIADGNMLIKKGHPNARIIKLAQIVGNKYVLVNYANSQRCYVYNASDVQILAESSLKQGNVFCYFRDVAQQRWLNATGSNKKNIAENICKQLDKTIANPASALEAYCHGKNATRRAPENLIYPFGLNESQMLAVEKAFNSQISVIEGPPGTGKTQTILNILANILMQNGSVAVVSNNNTAVDNVYEKLEKANLDYVVARLGSSDNRKQFFETQPVKPNAPPDPAPKRVTLAEQISQLKKHLRAQNEVAHLRAEIDELCIEEKYLNQWFGSQGIDNLPKVDRYRLKKHKITDLMAFFQSLSRHQIGWRNRLTLLLRFGIINTASLNTALKRQTVFFALQRQYYTTCLQQARARLTEREQTLKSNDVEALQQCVTKDSMAFLHEHLSQTIGQATDFNDGNYRKNFADFIKRYPIIGSSTHSIINSLAHGTLLDYIIIDEASQQDIIPGILALACAKNVIVVGDRKQLPHVPESMDLPAPAPHYDCVSKSLLDSLYSLYSDALPVTLLKEHYRCHPKIIHFCNQQFYDNQLIAMTRDQGESALSLVVTAKGNHERRYSNLRELESLVALEWDKTASRGFIAPYNAQVDLSARTLPAEFINSTVHKFQGRECEQIIFSTVIDKKANAKTLDFVDNPQLINVAVSRAQKHFTLVTGDNVFTGNNKHIAALVRYMTYYADDKQIHYSPVVSAFDLLYAEYDRSLEKLQARLNPEDSKHRSEQIVMRLIQDVLKQPAYGALIVHSQILLRQLVTNVNNRFGERQKEFMAQGASCDFVIYYRVGKQPFAVIEVDGQSHDAAKQRERDAIKESILAESGMALLRLRTIDSQIESKIASFLLTSMQESSVELTI